MRIGIATLKQLRTSRLVQAFEDHCRSVVSDRNIPCMDAPTGP